MQSSRSRCIDIRYRTKECDKGNVAHVSLSSSGEVCACYAVLSENPGKQVSIHTGLGEVMGHFFLKIRMGGETLNLPFSFSFSTGSGSKPIADLFDFRRRLSHGTTYGHRKHPRASATEGEPPDAAGLAYAGAPRRSQHPPRRRNSRGPPPRHARPCALPTPEAAVSLRRSPGSSRAAAPQAQTRGRGAHLRRRRHRGVSPAQPRHQAPRLSLSPAPSIAILLIRSLIPIVWSS